MFLALLWHKLQVPAQVLVLLVLVLQVQVLLALALAQLLVQVRLVPLQVLVPLLRVLLLLPLLLVLQLQLALLLVTPAPQVTTKLLFLQKLPRARGGFFLSSIPDQSCVLHRSPSPYCLPLGLFMQHRHSMDSPAI